MRTPSLVSHPLVLLYSLTHNIYNPIHILIFIVDPKRSLHILCDTFNSTFFYEITGASSGQARTVSTTGYEPKHRTYLLPHNVKHLIGLL